MQLKDTCAVVTGASTGIGRAIAVALARQGAFVFLVARSEDGLLHTKKMIEDVGKKSAIVVADLSSVDSINNLITDIKDKTKKIHLLVNVAGIWHGQQEVYANTNYDAFAQKTIVDTYMVGTIAPSLLAHAFIPLMPPEAHIINISGTFENGAKGWLPYYVSKRAIEDLTVGLSQELKDRSIRVNCISPSDTATEQYAKYFPEYIADAVNPDVIAEYVVTLCTDEKKEQTGKVIVIKKGKPPHESFHG